MDKTKPDFTQDLSIDRLIEDYTKDPENRRKLLEAETRHDLSQFLKELRERHGISQVELAKRVGKTQPLIARLEAGAYDRMGFSGIRTYARALGVDFVDIKAIFRDIEASFTGSSADFTPKLDEDFVESSPWDTWNGRLTLVRRGLQDRDVAA